MKYNIHYILNKKFSNRIYSLLGDELKNIEYHNDIHPITEQELIQADLELQKIEHIESRIKIYPDPIDLLLSIFDDIENNQLDKKGSFYKSINDINNQFQPPID